MKGKSLEVKWRWTKTADGESIGAPVDAAFGGSAATAALAQGPAVPPCSLHSSELQMHWASTNSALSARDKLQATHPSSQKVEQLDEPSFPKTWPPPANTAPAQKPAQHSAVPENVRLDYVQTSV